MSPQMIRSMIQIEVRSMRGSPRPEIRIGALVLDERLHPGIVADDEIRGPIRRVMLDGSIRDTWASEIVLVDEKEFELAIALREVGG